MSTLYSEEQNGHLKKRYSLGSADNIFKKGDFNNRMISEYGRSYFKKDLTNTTDDVLNEFFVRLGQVSN